MVNTVERVTSLLYLNEITLLLGAPGYLQNTNHKGFRVAITLVRLLLLWLALFTVPWNVGRWLLLVSVVLYALEYFATFFRKNDDTFENVTLCYVVAHVSLFNFLFDRPGFAVGSPFAPIVAVANIILIAYSVVYLTFAFQFNAAWSCYG